MAALLIVSLYSVGYALRQLEMPVREWLVRGCLRAAFCTLPLLVAGAAIRAVWPARSLLEVAVQMAVAGTAYGAAVWVVGLQADERGQVWAVGRQAWSRLRGGA